MLVDDLATKLQERILRGEIPTGTRLRQEAIADEFGISRTPVREALRKLQAQGVVELQPRRGAVVRAPTAREIREAYQVRAELEGLAAELAAGRMRDDQLRRLREAERVFRDSAKAIARRREDGTRRPTETQIRNWGRANDAFHQTVHEAAGNERLAALLEHLHQSFPRDLTRLVLRESSQLLHENAEQHRAILDAIERRDARAARALMIEHVRRAGELVTLRFEQQSANGG